MGHQLHCSVCENILESKESWNKHLLEESHQKLARKECSNRWWADEQLRQCCLALFSSVPLSPQLCEEIISEFSKKMNVYVTDFVWWNGRPKVALLQFESKNMAKQIWKGHGEAFVGSIGHRVQLRKAWAYLQLEWEELVGVPEIDSKPELENASDSFPSCKSEGATIDLLVKGQTSLKTKYTNYEWIQNVMTYPTELLVKLQRFIESFKKLQTRGNYQTGLVRNHYLGIRSSNLPEMVHVVIYAPGENRNSKDKINQLMLRLDNQFCLAEFKRDARFGTVLQSHSSPTLLNILTLADCQQELQMCRLILYLCQLDSRLRGVLTLVEFWARYHDLKVANNLKGRTLCPDPLGLHLLVVVYFMNEKLLPSILRLRRQPSPTPDKKKKKNNQNDVYGTFVEDDTFVNFWRKNHTGFIEESPAWMESVVELTRNCFQFFSEKLSTGDWLLSCYDGAVINSRIVPKGRDWPVIGSKKKGRISLAHPFNRLKRCAFDVRTWERRMCPIMGETAKQLSEYLAGQHLRLADVLAGDLVYHRRVQEWLDSCELKNCTLNPLT